MPNNKYIHFILLFVSTFNLIGCKKKVNQIEYENNSTNLNNSFAKSNDSSDKKQISKPKKAISKFILKNQARVKTNISEGVFFEPVDPKVILLLYKNISGHDIKMIEEIKEALSDKGYKVVTDKNSEQNIGAIIELNLFGVEINQRDKDKEFKKDLISNCITGSGLLGGFTFISIDNFFIGGILGGLGVYVLSLIIDYEPASYTMKMEAKISHKSKDPIHSDNIVTLNYGVDGKEYLKWQDNKYAKSYKVRIDKSIKFDGREIQALNILKHSMINTIVNLVN